MRRNGAICGLGRGIRRGARRSATSARLETRIRTPRTRGPGAVPGRPHAALPRGGERRVAGLLLPRDDAVAGAAAAQAGDVVTVVVCVGVMDYAYYIDMSSNIERERSYYSRNGQSLSRVAKLECGPASPSWPACAWPMWRS